MLPQHTYVAVEQDQLCDPYSETHKCYLVMPIEERETEYNRLNSTVEISKVDISNDHICLKKSF